MLYRGARDKSLLEIVRSGFLGPVPNGVSSSTSKEENVQDKKTVADVLPYASTCHRIATYELRAEDTHERDQMLVDQVVSQWDIVEFLSQQVENGKNNSDESLSVFSKSLRALGLAGSKEHPREEAEMNDTRDGSEKSTSHHARRQTTPAPPVTVLATNSTLAAFALLRGANVSCVGTRRAFPKSATHRVRPDYG